jgi:hypothetical protein
MNVGPCCTIKGFTTRNECMSRFVFVYCYLLKSRTILRTQIAIAEIIQILNKGQNCGNGSSLENLLVTR